MTFDIHQPVFDKESGDYLEDVAIQYREELVALFDASVEGQTLKDEGIEPGWADTVIDLGINYMQVTPAQMSAPYLRTILFQIIPQKIAASASEVPEAIRELQLFWTFLQREFHLENAASCLKLLSSKGTIPLIQELMENPANFGLAKSLITMGMQRGFDMTTQEGINEWIETYNAEIKAGTGTPVPLPGIPGMPGTSTQRSPSTRKTQANKAKRKTTKSSRKQNRPKK
jgi:hypothetical protein